LPKSLKDLKLLALPRDVAGPLARDQRSLPPGVELVEARDLARRVGDRPLVFCNLTFDRADAAIELSR
jgi:hypothetical protein